MIATVSNLNSPFYEHRLTHKAQNCRNVLDPSAAYATSTASANSAPTTPPRWRSAHSFRPAEAAAIPSLLLRILCSPEIVGLDTTCSPA